MFLLFRRGGSYIEKTLPLSLRNLGENPGFGVTEKTCLLCKRLNANSSVLPSRSQSSVTNPNLNKLKKKKTKKKTSSSYADILVVTQEYSRFKKANVIKLKPNELNLLATTNISLNELYKLKDLHRDSARSLPHTYSNLTVEGVSSLDAETSLKPALNPSTEPVEKIVPKPQVLVDDDPFGAVEDPDLESELDLKNVSARDSLQPEIIEEKPEIEEVHGKANEVDEKSAALLKHRDTIASKTLAAYAQVCNHLRNPQRGLSALYFHQNLYKRKGTRLSNMKNIKVYSTLLKGFANKGDYQKIQKILSIMTETKTHLDVNCYAAIFECLGRINIEQHYLKDIRIHVKEALKQGISLDKIMNEAIFLNDEREHVLNALVAYDPDYVPNYREPEVWYKNSLVNHLNDAEQLNCQQSDSLDYNLLISKEKMGSLVEKQLEIEQKGYVTIPSIERKAPATTEIVRLRSVLNDHCKLWRESAQAAFTRDIATLAAKRNIFNLEPFLRSVPAKDIVEIIVQEAMRIAQGSETFSPEVFLLYKMLGGKVYGRYKVLRKQKTGILDKTKSIHTKFCENYAATLTELDSMPHKENLSNPRIQWQLLEHQECKDSVTLNMGHHSWVPTTLTEIGKFLYHIIMHDLKIDVNSLRPNSKHKNFLPAFYTIFRNQGRTVTEEIKPHPILTRLYKASQPETLTFPAEEVPMLCPPIPWTSIHNGGYLIASTDIVRLPLQAYTQRKRMTEAGSVQLYPNFDALNQLSSVPWKVNTKVLDVILEVFRNGGSSKLDVPEHPSSLPLPPSSTADMDKSEKYQIFRQKLQYRRKKGEMYSLWCDCLYRLSLANYFRDDYFWLPHNMDFRGRVYPVPPHLNHLGSDLARSMLVFAEARPLGPEGLDWLKIHLINLTGLKKRDSIKDRLAYANDIIHLILDSADDPLNGQRWWAKSDEPWQTLACCMEIADVIRSGLDPALYRSHFPVHQDGSCNGLQHYAALGRDSAGAYSVNLAASEVPQDVYSAVVNLVEEQRVKDEAEGMEIAKVLNGFVKRKVIKQTIMTTVYGVTRFGARLQIIKQLKDIDEFPKEFVWAASSYLTARTFESLRTMFTSTKEIQDWFTECARSISGVGGSLVEWVTPLGLPVVQPYIRYKKIHMPSGYESFVLDQFDKPNVMKQKNAFPPNFIHSLDSSHMMLTSLHCARAGITFVSVHDCYWTHASTIHIMNKICREQFVALHSEPILENLSFFLYELYSIHESNFKGDGSSAELNKKRLNKILKQLPQKGKFDIKNVLSSIYFFS